MVVGVTVRLGLTDWPMPVGWRMSGAGDEDGEAFVEGEGGGVGGWGDGGFVGDLELADGVGGEGGGAVVGEGEGGVRA